MQILQKAVSFWLELAIYKICLSSIRRWRIMAQKNWQERNLTLFE
ncbi:MAG: hypothetical protein V7676_15600 [Parasphingorhabdus sp.]